LSDSYGEERAYARCDSTGTERGIALLFTVSRIDCDGDGNALALISKMSENYQKS